MEIRDIVIDEGVPEDVVQFVKHIEENLDPDGEYNCEVWLETVHFDDYESLPGDEIPMQGTRSPVKGHGVRVLIRFDDNSDCPQRQLSDLTDSFYNGNDGFRVNSHFDGGEGRFEWFCFETEE